MRIVAQWRGTDHEPESPKMMNRTATELESLNPALVMWEAWRERAPGEWSRDHLSTMEAMRLMNEVRCFGRIAFQLVGRPLRRADVGVLIEHGARIGLSMRLAAGADPLPRDLLEVLRDARLQRVVLDADTRSAAQLHAEIADARAVGLGVHVQTEVTAARLATLGSEAAAYARAGVHVWQLSFGAAWRGSLDAALGEIAALSRDAELQLEVAGAPQLARFLDDAARARVSSAPVEGQSLLYVSAEGVVQPSAQVPLTLGNVRHDDVVDVFRDAPELCALRDPEALHGKCRACEFRYLCGGGSRARAFAATGDWLAPDPECAHQPALTA